MTIWIMVFAALIFLPRSAGGQEAPELERYEVVADGSRVYAVTHKAGLFSFLGHEHAVVPEDWNARLCLAEPIPEGAHGSVVIRTESLVIDSDSARSLAGLGGGPGDEDRLELQRKMLDAEHLDAARHPEIRLDLRATGPSAEGRVTARGRLALHGVEREAELPLTVVREEGRLRLDGHLRIRQTDFGMEPESTAGVVKVADEVDLYFEMTVRPTGEACAEPGAAGGRPQKGRAGPLRSR